MLTKPLLTITFDPLKKAIEELLLNRSSQKAIHRLLADYFEYRNESSIRQREEQPWQYIQAKEWTLLHGLLSRPGFMKDCMYNDQSNFYHYWEVLEQNSLYSIDEAYEELFETPDKFQDLFRPLMNLYRDHGYMALSERAIQMIDKKAISSEERIKVLNDNAGRLRSLNRYEEMLKELSKAETLCREIGDHSMLLTVLANQVDPLVKLNRLDLAATKNDEAEKLIDDSVDDRTLQGIVNNKVLLLMNVGKLLEAEDLLNRRENICKANNDRFV